MNPNESHVSKSDRRGDDLFSAGEGSEPQHDATAPLSTVQETHTSLGMLLAHAREQRGLDIETCAHALKLPSKVLLKLERDQVQGIDYQVYMRGYLRKYGAYLGLDPALIEASLDDSHMRQPQLVSTGGIPRSRYLFERYATAATYAVLTGVIIVPLVWLGVNGGLGKRLTQLAPLDSAPVAAPVASGGPSRAADRTRKRATSNPPATQDERPLMASIAPFPAMDSEAIKPKMARPQNIEGQHTVTLALAAPSWVEITTADGQRLEYSLLPAGTHKQYNSMQALNVRIGNASAARVQVDGKRLPLDDYRHANVAYFQVDAGKVTPEHG